MFLSTIIFLLMSLPFADNFIRTDTKLFVGPLSSLFAIFNFGFHQKLIPFVRQAHDPKIICLR